MATDWISTKEAKRLLGVGSTTIKRWADEGRLKCSRTAGGHRRYRRYDVLRLAKSLNPNEDWSREARTWEEWLMERDLSFIVSKMYDLEEIRGDWFSVANFLGEVAVLIGANWADGQCTVIEEHIASMKLSQGISATSASLLVGEDSVVSYVATLPGERHGIGALLAQLCLRSIDLNAVVLGTEVQPAQLAAHVTKTKPRLLALSASAWLSDGVTLEREANRLGASCRRAGTELVTGGEGAWPDTPEFGYRCRSFDDFRSVLQSLDIA